MHVLHVVWKWIQISRNTYVNVISRNRPCIWWPRELVDRTLLSHPTWCSSNCLPSHSSITLICSYVNSDNIFVLWCNQDVYVIFFFCVSIGYRRVGRSFFIWLSVGKDGQRNVDAFYSGRIRISNSIWKQNTTQTLHGQERKQAIETSPYSSLSGFFYGQSICFLFSIKISTFLSSDKKKKKVCIDLSKVFTWL